jgi:hypothetical protein
LEKKRRRRRRKEKKTMAVLLISACIFRILNEFLNEMKKSSFQNCGILAIGMEKSIFAWVVVSSRWT